jgi:hypothetical protein
MFKEGSSRNITAAKQQQIVSNIFSLGSSKILLPTISNKHAEVWALYKEVASYYDAGLNPPEDVTLLFPDDNSGNVYRLPTGDEVNRKGGTGV